MVVGSGHSEVEDSSYRRPVRIGAKPESKALGEDLHTQIVAQHLRHDPAEFFIARNLDDPAEQPQTQPEILVFIRDQDRHFRFIPGAQLVEPAHSYNSRTAAILQVMLRHQHYLPVVVTEANAEQALMSDAGAEC